MKAVKLTYKITEGKITTAYFINTNDLKRSMAKIKSIEMPNKIEFETVEATELSEDFSNQNSEKIFQLDKPPRSLTPKGRKRAFNIVIW